MKGGGDVGDRKIKGGYKERQRKIMRLLVGEGERDGGGGGVLEGTGWFAYLHSIRLFVQ